jgi:hypothetical protein
MQWPPLPYAEWSDTKETLHLWTQVVGKIRMERMPPVNHWWHVTLYVTSRGLSTLPIPDGDRTFDIDFDFVAHRLRITTSDGVKRGFDLRPMSVADFYQTMVDALAGLGMAVKINTRPSEITDPIRFEEDRIHKSYDADAVSRFWHVLVSSCQVMTRFRSQFIGKVSPVHYFWGGMDLAVTRFSGRGAPEHGPVPLLPLAVVREAYSHEVSSAGFWPGGAGFDAAFYAYAYPEPATFAKAPVRPAEARYDDLFREFMLPYELMRKARSPEDALLNFLQSTYDAGADLGRWPREQLERQGARHGIA